MGKERMLNANDSSSKVFSWALPSYLVMNEYYVKNFILIAIIIIFFLCIKYCFKTDGL